MYQPSPPNNWPRPPWPGWHHWFALLFVGAFALALSGCQQLKEIDQLRTDFVALRYLSNAAEAATEPVDRDKVIHNATRAVALASGNTIILDQAGRIYLSVGAYARALSVLQKAHLLTGQPYYYELGACFLHTGQQELGLEYLTRHLQRVKLSFAAGTISKQPYTTELNNIGYVYAQADIRLERALDLTQEAVEYAPLNAAFIDSLGWVYYKLGNLQEATFYLQRAVRQSLSQPSAELHYHLGVVYARSGRREAAARELTKARQIRPQYPQATDELRKLQWELAPPWYAILTESDLS